MSIETDRLLERVQSDPQFHELVRRRSRLAWLLTALMIVIYFGFVLTIAYNKEFLAQSLSGGVTTVGIPVGLGVILSAFVLTGIYVARANTAFDDLTKQIIERLKK
ncbi:MAG: hypothetical protein B7Y80_08185 [Hyphomicrobium sp. 32-62-53]|nr:MAG: hypothetical protein B7Z29_16135 [Hyphomicrobium sp. 12-62-95]OYY00117.1 MAG: hypothetical protein B7Y80_08185 [Hyphomicrobium sp. 32-62-53]